jgi:NTE family protein
LATLSVSEQEYAEWRRRVTVRQEITTRIAGVEFEGLERINPEYLRTLTTVHAGDTVDIAAISHDASRLAVVDGLDSVEYKLKGDPDNPVLVWQPREQQNGPDYLRPSVGLYGAGSGDLAFEMSVEHVRRWINPYGAEWRNRLQFGSDSLLRTSVYQPLNIAQTYFVEPSLLARRSLEDVYNDDQRVARYQFYDLGGRVDFGANLGHDGQIRAGYFASKRRAEVDIGTALLPVVDSTDAGLAATATYDSREAESFAIQGLAAELDYYKSDSSLGAARDWQRIEAAARKSVPAGKVMLWFTVAGGTDLGSALPHDRAFALGGPQSFPGYGPGQIRAGRYWTMDGSFLWKVADILPILSQKLYGGFKLEGGRVYERVDPVPDGSVYGVSVFVGGRTPIGTLTLGVGWADPSTAFWVTLGTPVGTGTGSILNQPLFR